MNTGPVDEARFDPPEGRPAAAAALPYGTGTVVPLCSAGPGPREAGGSGKAPSLMTLYPGRLHEDRPAVAGRTGRG